MDSFLGVPPAELSRRISDLDLGSDRRPSITQLEDGRRYTITELNGLRPEQENGDHAVTPEGVKTPVTPEGVKTPPEVPAPPPTPHNELSSSDGALADIDTNTEEQTKKKKKKKKSGKSKKAAPTGFEEFYADTPITPGEHNEESEIYASCNPFHERIQTCIQRYRKRRNLDSTRSNILTKYFMLGGIEASTTKQFSGGLDKDTINNSTAKEIAEIQATDFIRSGHNSTKYYDPENPEHWVVDFEGIAKGFFSSMALKRIPTDTEEEIKVICGVVRNFLNYVLLHNVCPEYAEDVMAARSICNLAETELWNMRRIRSELPGNFNKAASALYGTAYKSTLAEPQWGPNSNIEDHESQRIVHERSIEQAERVFQTVIAYEGTNDMFGWIMDKEIKTTKKERKFVEVVQIDRAPASRIKDYSYMKDAEGATGYLKAVGKIYFKHWVGPELEPEDLTDSEDEDEELRSPPRPGNPVEEFWLEDHLLDLCFVGMKLEVSIHELDAGVRFIDDVHSVYCSFYTLLPNEKVLENWKEPVPNIRPPPTEDNPDVEQDAMDAELDREMRDDTKGS